MCGTHCASSTIARQHGAAAWSLLQQLGGLLWPNKKKGAEVLHAWPASSAPRLLAARCEDKGQRQRAAGARKGGGPVAVAAWQREPRRCSATKTTAPAWRPSKTTRQRRDGGAEGTASVQGKGARRRRSGQRQRRRQPAVSRARRGGARGRGAACMQRWCRQRLAGGGRTATAMVESGDDSGIQGDDVEAPWTVWRGGALSSGTTRRQGRQRHRAQGVTSRLGEVARR